MLVLMATRTGVLRPRLSQRRRLQLRARRGQECAVRSPATGVLIRPQCVLKMHRSAVQLVKAASMLLTGAAVGVQGLLHARK